MVGSAVLDHRFADLHGGLLVAGEAAGRKVFQIRDYCEYSTDHGRPAYLPDHNALQCESVSEESIAAGTMWNVPVL